MKKNKIVLPLIIGLVAVFVILENRKPDEIKGVKENKMEEKHLTSGDDNSHWYHLKGKIEVIDKKNNRIQVIITEESIFNTNKVWLDCSDEATDLEKMKDISEVTFYFFKSRIQDDTVKVEKLVYD